MTSFSDLSLDTGLLSTLTQLGFTSPTPIQAAALPAALEGRDLIARAATGSGKTAVFALSLLSRLNLKFFGVQALVLCPTRELADQVAAEVRKLGRSRDHLKVVTLCGGVPIRGQAASLEHGAHVIVGTPGRVLDHLERRTLKLDGLRTLVLDEADRMLEMGFFDDMVSVARLCPPARQTLLFSATYPPQIDELAGPFLKHPLTVSTRESEAEPNIEQKFYAVENPDKPRALAALLEHYRPETALVFVNTKVAGREVVASLQSQGFSAMELSGDLEQRERDEVMTLFSSRCLSVLVATDVASRGLDIPVLDAVITYDSSHDPEVRVHRVGRTGRAGEKGLALHLVTKRAQAQLDATLEPTWELPPSSKGRAVPPRAMLKLLDGKKDKLRPGDVLGALTAAAGFQRDQVGNIKVTEWGTWIAVDRNVVDEVQKALLTVPIKGKIRRLIRIG